MVCLFDTSPVNGKYLEYNTIIGIFEIDQLIAHGLIWSKSVFNGLRGLSILSMSF